MQFCKTHRPKTKMEWGQGRSGGEEQLYLDLGLFKKTEKKMKSKLHERESVSCPLMYPKYLEHG